MSRPPLAKERVLDAFEAILVDDGDRAATMDATARAAGVSKGGLLYHFASKEALEGALLERLRILVAEDVAAIEAAEDGAIAYFLRSSIMQNDPLDRAILAASRLAQGGKDAAGDALRAIRDEWARVLRPHARDETALNLVMLVSDGLYFNNALAGGSIPGPVPEGPELDALIALVEKASRDGVDAPSPAISPR
ncbi:TetR/AcrR family transcriptional regulator [Microbacterium aurantiacum]|uniref:TetR/AcrR family transcriptional regulator n=2 Tax=Microbacterium aurantiacum TaxID=162393 RepID=A0AAJ2LWI3_9MICO|nr:MULTISPECIES: TetR/AcrR family transcriptional regulator [Microbacterium]ANG85942.1 transcriptional regulator [Microbacterium chocolatum]KOS10365.1 transcriptional regulator [Microbacterium chocolatum]MDN4463837.1 TetR/AcrR family transcriptional regulator [Microbacterium aurantiacum]MDS0246370.1 TetR/AcrR family transcriptional regulator [Microbacterium aurantiacum]